MKKLCISTEIEIVRIQLREHFKIKYAHRGDGTMHGAQQHRSLLLQNNFQFCAAFGTD